MKHWIAMAGIHGCLPNYSSCCDTYEDAVATLTALHDLGRDRRRELAERGTLELKMQRDGNEYCEIVSCECATPEDHDEGGQ
jgi:hypothetical protein